MSYQRDRSWSDQYLPTLQRLIGPYLLCPSSVQQDREQAADLVVLIARGLTIACRVRRHGYAQNFPHQFTIRSARDSGAKTELTKIVEGWGDWLFYGHATAAGLTIDPWWIIDLHSWRAHMIMTASKNAVEWGRQSNGDGTHFVWFDIKSFPPDPKLLVASSDNSD